MMSSAPAKFPWKETVKPLLRKVADDEIDTSTSLDDVLSGELYIAQSLSRLGG